jgi:hypothetical protein
MSRSKYDNSIKQEALSLGYDKQVKQISKAFYKGLDKAVIVNRDGEAFEVESYECFVGLASHIDKLLDCALRLNESQYRKSKRVRDKVKDLVINGNAIFVTLTFRDSVLAKTSPLTRRKYVARYLKQYSRVYVANVDFGNKNDYIDRKGNKRQGTEREHYHAIVSSELDFKAWKYGSVDVERVRNHDKDIKRTARYITKLTNHALKVEGLQPRLIYSRGMD